MFLATRRADSGSNRVTTHSPLLLPLLSRPSKEVTFYELVTGTTRLLNTRVVSTRGDFDASLLLIIDPDTLLYSTLHRSVYTLFKEQPLSIEFWDLKSFFPPFLYKLQHDIIIYTIFILTHSGTNYDKKMMIKKKHVILKRTPVLDYLSTQVLNTRVVEY